MISIVIPVLNEAATITTALTNIKNITESEIIVVDGGSQDETVELARFLGVKVILSAPGRARQMNAGAEVAKGDLLLFLHADTRLPADFETLICQTLWRSSVVAGAFELQIDARLLGLRLIEKMANWRSHFCSLPYGDQAIFLKAEIFHRVGGFPDLPIMEDFEFIRQLKRLGRIAIVPKPVITSGRRWQKLGAIRTTAINQLVIVAYFLGVPPRRIACWYRQGFKF
jgi:rSAM/selenodomain-associated transferase 2